MSPEITLVATCSFGLEAVVKRELIALGFENLRGGDGKIAFRGSLLDMIKANLWLRSADRVLLQVAEFPASDFDALFDQTAAVPWEDWISKDGKFPVVGKSVKSQLHSVPACQSMIKKAIVERLKSKYRTSWFDENGPEFRVVFSIHQNTVSLNLDTSGLALHKRGYRSQQGVAPLKETLAAALVQLSYWAPDRYLLDPFCGSGTIPIEAAMIGLRMAPGLRRKFAAEQWPHLDRDAWEKARKEARSQIRSDASLQIYGCDADPQVIEHCKHNATLAGVESHIDFQVKTLDQLWIDRPYGIVISNPPYGHRLADNLDLNATYRTLNQMFRKKPGWSIYILTADENFAARFQRPLSRTRKLFNGNIQVRYYQYTGERPPSSQ